MTKFTHGQIFKMSKKGVSRDDFYILTSDGPDHFILVNLSYGSRLTAKHPHSGRHVTMDTIETLGASFISGGYIFEPIKNVVMTYEIMPVVPTPKTETAKLAGGH